MAVLRKKRTKVRRTARSVSQWLETALAALAAKKHALAIESFGELLALEPNHFLGLLYRGDAHCEAGDLRAARADWRLAGKANPISYLPELHSGLARVEARQYRAAIRDFERSIEKTAHNPEAWNGRGEALFWLKSYADSIAAHTRAIRLSDRHAKHYKARYLANRAEAEVHLKQFDRAKEDCDHSLALVPNDDFALYIRGLAHHGLGNSPKAMTDWRTAAGRGNADARKRIAARR